MHVCPGCGDEFATGQALGGHIGSHNRGDRYLHRRRGEGWNKCLNCEKSTSNLKFCSNLCWTLYRKQRAFRHYVDVDGRMVGFDLDITVEEMAAYRVSQLTCEICGKRETTLSQKLHDRPNKLSVDHCHNTARFRGLLCSVCNRQLGWYERNMKNIEAYLDKPVWGSLAVPASPSS